MNKHTSGPWRWEVNSHSKHMTLCGGKPQYDLIILEPARWGMGSATLMLRDVAHDGMNILHKLHERPDWLVPHPGREHHVSWCAGIAHPDASLIAAAPDLLEALQGLLAAVQRSVCAGSIPGQEEARAAIAKATGEQP